MASSHHLSERNILNQKCTVAILYQLCLGYSQKCNFFKEDNGLFLKFCNLKLISKPNGNLLLLFPAK